VGRVGVCCMDMCHGAGMLDHGREGVTGARKFDLPASKMNNEVTRYTVSNVLYLNV
jgi:hypothetical protein